MFHGRPGPGACFVLDGDPEQAGEWIYGVQKRSGTRAGINGCDLRSQAPAAPLSTGRVQTVRWRVYRRGGENLLPQLVTALSLPRTRSSCVVLIQLGVDRKSLVKVTSTSIASPPDDTASGPTDLTWTVTRSTRGRPDHLTIGCLADGDSMGKTIAGQARRSSGCPGPRRPGRQLFEPSAGQWDSFWRVDDADQRPRARIPASREHRAGAGARCTSGGPVSHNVMGAARADGRADLPAASSVCSHRPIGRVPTWG
jgi:hypothetical protein